MARTKEEKKCGVENRRQKQLENQGWVVIPLHAKGTADLLVFKKSADGTVVGLHFEEVTSSRSGGPSSEQLFFLHRACEKGIDGNIAVEQDDDGFACLSIK